MGWSWKKSFKFGTNWLAGGGVLSDPLLGLGFALSQEMSRETSDKYLNTYAGLHLFGGDMIRENSGYNRRQQHILNDEEKRQRQYFKNQSDFAPQAPEKSAMMIETNADIRDRQRKAALFGASQLKIHGPGIASGGGFGGANAPLY